jgi:hypothetical protein
LVKNLKPALADCTKYPHNARPMAGITLLREKVAEAVDEGADLKELEASVIDHASLDAESRDALWLYAWNLLEQDHKAAARFLRTPAA